MRRQTESGGACSIIDELRQLLVAAHNGPDAFRLFGLERALLYWLAVETGLRANELRSLTRLSSVRLQGGHGRCGGRKQQAAEAG